jgi:hypothetical protein
MPEAAASAGERHQYHRARVYNIHLRMAQFTWSSTVTCTTRGRTCWRLRSGRCCWGKTGLIDRLVARMQPCRVSTPEFF